MGASLLGLFLSERLSQRIRDDAAWELMSTLTRRGCAAAVLAAAGGEGAVDALIAAAKREGDAVHVGNAFLVLGRLAEADVVVRERAASADAALLPVAVARMRAAAAGAASFDAVLAFQGPLLLLNKLTMATAASARALATPGMAAPAVDLLMALGSEEWAAVKGEWTAEKEEWMLSWARMKNDTLMMLTASTLAGKVACAAVFDAVTSRGALPRVLELLRSPNKEARTAASVCISELAGLEGGCDALFLVPRAASELTAALRRAHADGDDPSLTQCHAVRALSRLLCHSQGARVAEGLVRAAMAEGSASSLLGALAGLLTASTDGGGYLNAKCGMLSCGTAVLIHMVAAARTKQLLLVPVLQRSPLAEACVHALRYWLAKKTDGDWQMVAFPFLPFVVATLAGCDDVGPNATVGRMPAATADTAATRAALREAAGIDDRLRRLLAWARRRPHDEVKRTIAATKWLLRLPEVQAPAAAAVSQALAATGATVRATAGPAAAASTPALAPAAAAAMRPPAAASLSAMQQPRGGSSSGGSSGGGSSASTRSSGSTHSNSGGGGCSAVAVVVPRACGGCGKSQPEVRLLRCVGCKATDYCGDACARAHWPSHRAACKATAVAPPPPAAASRRSSSSGSSGSRSTCSNDSSSSSSSGSGGGCIGLAAVQPQECGGCGKGEPEVRLLRCVGCKAQHYCGAACARAHWLSHRAACKAAARRVGC